MVFETYYVCLDYRSEFASFYAHIDAPRRSSTTRLHFFSERIKSDNIINLQSAQIDSYLGYIVCREGDLPLVGRTVIQCPSYIDESTAIIEPVNFFGQRLAVRGVPFMQQDQRFAVCSHVATWVLHYSAFRRGTQERRHIADLVGMVGPIQPLRPRASDGLTESQVAHILDEIGFRTAINHSPTIENNFQTLPDVVPLELPSHVIAALDRAGVANLGWPDPDVIGQLSARFGQFIDDLYADNLPQTSIPLHPTFDAVHHLLDYFIRPYIRSGWPIYAGTRTHAFVICGRSWANGRPVHFLHDDQNGPYLVATHLPAISRGSLWRQTGYEGASGRIRAPEADNVAEVLTAPLELSVTADRAIESFVTAVPPRVLLSPSAANRRSVTILTAMRTEPLLASLSDAQRIMLERLEMRTSIVMGIDYKLQRRAAALGSTDMNGVRAFSSLQLAEWVIVVEAIDQAGSCFAEFVYDASSGDEEPLLQVARAFIYIVTVWPLGEPNIESATLQMAQYPAVAIPERIGKVVARDEST